MNGAVEFGAGFELLVLAVLRAVGGAGEELFDGVLVEGLEGADGFERLFETRHAFHAGDDGGGGKVERIVEALDGIDLAAFEDVTTAEGFHAEHSDFFADEDGEHFFLEAFVMGVHDVEWHLDGIEFEAAFARGFENCEMADLCGR